MNARLSTFRDYFLRLPLPSTVLERREYSKLVAEVIWRQGTLQVERVWVKPNAIIRAHRHPNIDAYEAHRAGDLAIVIDADPERINRILEKIRPRAACKSAGQSILVKSSDWHGVKVGASGAEFLSIQCWSGNTPITAAGVDWDAPGDVQP